MIDMVPHKVTGYRLQITVALIGLSPVTCQLQPKATGRSV